MSSSLDWLRIFEARVREGSEIFCFASSEYGVYTFAIDQDKLDFFPEAWRVAQETGKKVNIFKIVGVVDNNDYSPTEFGFTPLRLSGSRFRPLVDWELGLLFYLMKKPREYPVFQIDYVFFMDPENEIHQKGFPAAFAPTQSSFFSTHPCLEVPPRLTPIQSLTDQLLKSISSERRAVLPAGPQILQMLEWDKHLQYDWGARKDHAWVMELGFQFHDDNTAAIRQTTFVYATKTWRKHEVTFAFEISNLVDASTIPFPGTHPGRGYVTFQSDEWSPLSYCPTPGIPGGVKLTFATPVRLHRWSCIPFTPDVLEHDVNSFDVSIWFPTESIATLAVQTFNSLREAAETSGRRVGVNVEGTVSRLGQIQRL